MRGESVYVAPTVNDWESSPLTVADIASLEVKDSQFAFLSACHTASGKLADESIHLISAIQLAGYASVVGTLWKVLDENSPEVSIEVYRSVFQDGNTFRPDGAAEGLHRAILDLRERTRIVKNSTKKYTHDPTQWASYVHVGV